jgi:hypothetical protein
MTTTLKFTHGAHDTSRVILTKFGALMTVKIKTLVFWVTTSCSFIGITSVSEEHSVSVFKVFKDGGSYFWYSTLS